MKIGNLAVLSALTMAFLGCTGSAYDPNQPREGPREDSVTTNLEFQSDDDTEGRDENENGQHGDSTAGDRSGLRIDVGEGGVDVEVGKGVDVEVDRQGGVNVDIGSEGE